MQGWAIQRDVDHRTFGWPSLVWQPMYNWIVAHTEHGQGKGDITMK